jgi:glycosyltransferase involved in cell wall biosynthesis
VTPRDGAASESKAESGLKRVLVAHNFYQLPGGEDVVFALEVGLLRERGHEVVEFTEHNAELQRIGSVAAAHQMIWSRRASARLLATLRNYSPQIAHFHNTFMLISPSAYYACQEAGVPVVQTLHNYRLVCPAATLFRDGCACEDCLRQPLPWPAVWHSCYRESRIQTAGVALMLSVHNWLQTWHQQVDIYVALTDFARGKFVEAGLPRDKIVVKPNFVHPDPGPRSGDGTYALFVGRLSPEKGLRTLLDAWEKLMIPLRIAGGGPLMNELQSTIHHRGLHQVEMLGHRSHEEIVSLMKGARFLIFPSLWYEGFPITLAMAFACGLPVIGSRLGAVSEIVRNAVTGMHFTPGDAEDLAGKVEWAWTNVRQMRHMGAAARQEYERKYTAARHYTKLMEIYDMALGRKH